MKDLTAYKALYKDDRFYQEVFVKEDYKAVFGRKKDTVIDVGALAGEFSFWIDGGTVYAIEPEREYYDELVSNIDKFGFTNVKPFNIALSKKSGPRSFKSQGRGGSALSGEGSDTVETLSLADFMDKNNIAFVDILKVDIENGEREVFNAEDFPKVAPRIKCIIGEHLTELQAVLERNGFKRIPTDNMNLLFEQ